MKCFVCDFEYDGKECPKCKFPEVVVPFGSDREASLKAMKQTVEKYRNEFAKKIKAELMVYNYDVTDKIVYQGEERCTLGKVNLLMSKVTWLDTEFTNVITRENLPITLNVSIEEQAEYQITVNIKNIPSDTLRVGISMDSGLNFSFIIKDAAGNSVRSDMFPIVQ